MSEAEAARVPLVVPAPSDNPLRKQTLLGIAPVLPEPPKPAPAPAESVPSIMTPPAVVATDAPTAREVEAPAEAAKPVISWPPPQPTSSEVDDDFAPKPKRARWLVPLGIAAALGAGVVATQQLGRAPAAAPVPVAAKPPAAPQPVEAKPKSEDDTGPSTGDDSVPDTRTPEPQPLGTAAAEAAPSAAPSSSAPPSGDVVRIQVNSDPPGARLFWKGKSVGTTPFVLELAPGEKHSYEMGLPGYNTRKVVIDGSKPEISIGLKPDSGTFIGGNRRKP
jgi:hypothetical protein